ncbi:MAG: hypothetical protein M3O34_17285 [Chloroflexota bacterium]|nr:hypothetical protein [Chloroflexota bacterium]
MNWLRDDGGREVIDTRPIMTDEECGESEAAETWRPRLDIGMYVRGLAGEEIGQVKEIRSGSFLVDRVGGEPVVLPYERIDTLDGDRILLNVAAAELEEARAPRSSFTDVPSAGDMR